MKRDRVVRGLSVCIVPVAMGALAALLEGWGVSDGFILLAVVCAVSAAGVVRRKELLKRARPPICEKPDLQQAEPQSKSAKAGRAAAG